MAENISEAIYKALRDDSLATNGIRALLGNTTTTPYNVYHAYVPESVDFSPPAGAVGFITYFMVTDTPNLEYQSVATEVVESIYNITAYHKTMTQLDKVLRRVRYRLEDMTGITRPTARSTMHKVRWQMDTTTKWDDEFKVWYRTSLYKVWYRNDDPTGNGT